MANMTSSVSASQVAGELASATFEEIPALVEHYREDPRQQVIKACERALKRHAKELAERERVNDMYELMHELGGDGVVVGVDEVGRGSVAGPLTDVYKRQVRARLDDAKFFYEEDLKISLDEFRERLAKVAFQETVSYTHLDVYKRQAEDREGSGYLPRQEGCQGRG